ncbi:hypothetical protein B9G53_01035 [Pseudanabaena sp. SR411]|uniref:hypothetical protein n=1 Tax=Pseudanabaena sp. SR411 TaxID=1980935 RepID=UPI000B990164|nr:hypothetical protein [Pseudanabaena sp. SR411]OYQ67567.1 hypothetical protein B9G53_01035 [Pseudanabaena sp. SR411]
MQFPSDPNQDKVTPLSKGKANQRGEELIGITEFRLEEALDKVLSRRFYGLQQQNEQISEQNEQISNKIERLQNSMDRIISQFTAIKNGETQDPALVVTTDTSKADLAVAEVKMYQEDYYTYLTKEIAKELNINIDKVVKLSNSLGLRNNSDYHKAIKSGKNKSGENTYVQKYSQPAFDKIKQEVEREKGINKEGDH